MLNIHDLNRDYAGCVQGIKEHVNSNSKVTGSPRPHLHPHFTAFTCTAGVIGRMQEMFFSFGDLDFGKSWMVTHTHTQTHHADPLAAKFQCKEFCLKIYMS